MSQHVTASSESDGLWLPLTEYAVRSGISLSTIRRKIKSNSIRFRLEKGRYLIYFEENGNHSEPAPEIEEPVFAQRVEPKEENDMQQDSWNLPIPDRAVKMISDAFDHTLKEKDERIRLLEQRNQDLEERLNELRTLVRALEEKYEVRY